MAYVTSPRSKCRRRWGVKARVVVREYAAPNRALPQPGRPDREWTEKACRVTRFDAAAVSLVDLWTAAPRLPISFHKASNSSKQKRTIDVLRKPDSSECYRQLWVCYLSHDEPVQPGVFDLLPVCPW
jgi:hypothetical protein